MSTSPSVRKFSAPVMSGASSARPGVLLVNLGTPERPTPKAVRHYLRAFLGDPRVVELPRLLWKPMLEGVVLPFRPARIARAYASIWHRDTDESPLRHYTRRQSERLQQRFAQEFRTIEVAWAMRYGEPSIEHGLGQLAAAGCTEILLLPLYPQYSATTTATVNDVAFAHLAKLRDQPSITTIHDFHDHPAYIDALASSLRRAMSDGPQPDHLLVSFHGLPERNGALGDPYAEQCRGTAERLRQRLHLTDTGYSVAFQSQFGRQKWVGPSTQAEVVQLAKAGVRHLMVIAPGFMADCLETLEEVQVEVRHLFVGAGGEQLTYVSCLNDSDGAIDVLESVVLDRLGGVNI
jgi:protoporphyrin/coproporphyrin ferrochelatase